MKIVTVQSPYNKNDKTWKEMIKDPMFYLMFAMLICGAFYGLMIISQTSILAQNMIKVTPATAAICVSVLALFNVGGRIGAGLLSDKLGRVNTLVTVLLLSVIGLIVLITSGDGEIVQFMAGISVIGFSFGAYMGIFPGFTAEQFGSKNSSENYGIMFIAFAFAGIFGPMILKNIYKAYGTYTYAFIIGICFALVGLTIAMLITARQTRQNQLKES
jgi:MFS family permease